jgi:hypothetical protein
MLPFPLLRYFVRLGSALSVTIALLASEMAALLGSGANAQTLPTCLPPQAEEYLLMIMNPTEAVQTQLQQALPPRATAIVCTYLQDVVLRVDSFTSADVANSWAQYISDMSDLQTFVVRPAIAPITAPTPTPTPAPAPAPAPAVTPSAGASSTFPQPTAVAPPVVPTVTPPAIEPQSTPDAATSASTTSPPVVAAAIAAYDPQPLGAGYVVLVDYANRPEVAAAVQQLLGRDVGLASYAQRPYLLATYTADSAAASSVLQILSDRNFTALIVDSRRVVLLTPAVK